MSQMIEVHELVRELLFVADKSASIARHFRYNVGFEKLVQEKHEQDGKNPRFARDFKTLADVLIQQVAVYWLELKFPGLGESVYGEESSEFTPENGVKLNVIIDENPQIITNILCSLIDDGMFIEKLIDIIYSSQRILEPILDEHKSPLIDLKSIAMWIDPIDSTSEFIRGQSQSSEALKGLECVTCLFGVFSLDNGLPLIGVVAQPFPNTTDSRTIDAESGQTDHRARLFWGYKTSDVCALNNLSPTTTTPTSPNDVHPEKQQISRILVGKNESTTVLRRLETIARTEYVSGAGFKLLCVAQCIAQGLVSSSRTTFLWDTCAGHAILRSLGGGLLQYDAFLQRHKQTTTLSPTTTTTNDQCCSPRCCCCFCCSTVADAFQIRYQPKQNPTTTNGDVVSSAQTVKHNNPNGLIAYRSVEFLNKLCMLNVISE